ncbi:MAG: indolepyruvate oxidoreductase subunit beta [Desulfatiglandales bacterium]
MATTNSRDFRIILGGVGGQGILFVTRILTEAALVNGLGVFGSEIHGMAQRGGAVVSHLKIGNPLGPLVRRGTADCLIAFEESEAYRNLDFLKKGGSCFVNCSGVGFPNNSIQPYFRKMQLRSFLLNATGFALEGKFPFAANLVLLGYAVATNELPLEPMDIERIIKRESPPRLLKANLKAFQGGIEAKQKRGPKSPPNETRCLQGL